MSADHRLPQQLVGEHAIVTRKIGGLEVRFQSGRDLSGIGRIRTGGAEGDLDPDAMIAAAFQKVDERAPLLRPGSLKVAELNVDQIETGARRFR